MEAVPFVDSYYSQGLESLHDLSHLNALPSGKGNLLNNEMHEQEQKKRTSSSYSCKKSLRNHILISCTSYDITLLYYLYNDMRGNLKKKREQIKNII